MMGLMSDRANGTALTLLGIASVQIGAALAIGLFEDLGPIGAVLVRTLLAGVMLIALWRPARASLDRGGLIDIAGFGLILAGMNTTFYLALDRLPLGIAVTLEFTGPLAVAILSSRRPRDLIWVALGAAGIVLLAPGIGDGLDPTGVAFALTAGAFWAAYILVSARVGSNHPGRGALAAAMLLAGLVLIGPGIAAAGSDLLNPRLVAIGAAVALLSSAVPYTAELEALRRLPAGVFGVLLSLEPAVAALVGLIALDQALAGRELIAIGLVVVASAGALRSAPPAAAADA